MTSQALMILIAFSLLKGALFGAAFAWIFPPTHRYLLGRLGRVRVRSRAFPSAAGCIADWLCCRLRASPCST